MNQQIDLDCPLNSKVNEDICCQLPDYVSISVSESVFLISEPVDWHSGESTISRTDVRRDDHRSCNLICLLCENRISARARQTTESLQSNAAYLLYFLIQHPDPDPLKFSSLGVEFDDPVTRGVVPSSSCLRFPRSASRAAMLQGLSASISPLVKYNSGEGGGGV
jgi:hypothetical protein